MADFHGGKHDLKKLDPPMPSLARNNIGADHRCKLRGDGIGSTAFSDCIRTIAAVGVNACERPVYVLSALQDKN